MRYSTRAGNPRRVQYASLYVSQRRGGPDGPLRVQVRRMRRALRSYAFDERLRRPGRMPGVRLGGFTACDLELRLDHARRLRDVLEPDDGRPHRLGRRWGWLLRRGLRLRLGSPDRASRKASPTSSAGA